MRTDLQVFRCGWQHLPMHINRIKPGLAQLIASLSGDRFPGYSATCKPENTQLLDCNSKLKNGKNIAMHSTVSR
jgi:hypothetical protein